MIVFTCARCGANYPPEHVELWGRSEESDGHGAIPKCTRLRDTTRRAFRSDGTQDGYAQEVCSGGLVAIAIADDELSEEDGSLLRVTPR